MAVFERTGHGWRVNTARGPAVTAPRLLLATNAYTANLLRGLRRTVTAVNSFQIATAELGGGYSLLIPKAPAQLAPGTKAAVGALCRDRRFAHREVLNQPARDQSARSTLPVIGGLFRKPAR